MDNTTITIRTDKVLKEQATALFSSLGMSLSSAINMFMRQAVIRQQFPCSLELSVTENYHSTYPEGFFELFGSGSDLGFDEEPAELSFEADSERISL